jgi:RNA polymerase sigma-70 factor, ECF subfamily
MRSEQNGLLTILSFSKNTKMSKISIAQLTHLYDDHADAVYRFSLRLCCGRHADAEDLTQETFVAAMDSWKRFLGKSTVRTWLFRIALYRHQAQTRRTAPTQVALLETVPTSENLAAQAMLRLTLSDALATLPDILHEAFILVKCEGMTYREAATLLGVPQGTVQSRVHEACCRLRQQLAYLEN